MELYTPLLIFRRIAACIVDYIVVMMITLPIVLLAEAAMHFKTVILDPDILFNGLTVLLFVMYTGTSLAINRRTFGGYCFKIQVQAISGGSPGFVLSYLRQFLVIVEITFWPFSLVVLGKHGGTRGLSDAVTGTRIVSSGVQVI